MNNISLRPISSCLAALYVLTLIVAVAGKSGSDGLITVRPMSWLLREISCLCSIIRPTCTLFLVRPASCMLFPYDYHFRDVFGI